MHAIVCSQKHCLYTVLQNRVVEVYYDRMCELPLSMHALQCIALWLSQKCYHPVVQAPG